MPDRGRVWVQRGCSGSPLGHGWVAALRAVLVPGVFRGRVGTLGMLEPPGDAQRWGSIDRCWDGGHRHLTGVHPPGLLGGPWCEGGGDLGWVWGGFASPPAPAQLRRHMVAAAREPHASPAGGGGGWAPLGRGGESMEMCVTSPRFHFCTGGSHPATARPAAAVSIAARFPFPDAQLPFQNFLLRAGPTPRRWGGSSALPATAPPQNTGPLSGRRMLRSPPSLGPFPA